MADIFLRRDVNGITPMDLKYMNDNFKYIWLKVFGNITTGDLLNGSISEDKLKDGAVTADKIAAGSVTAEKIEAKTITADQIDLTTLYVGTGGIRLDSSATISWNNVTDKQNVITSENLASSLDSFVTAGEWDDILIDYVEFGDIYTQIGSDYVLTGKVLANNILAGEIAGVTILTANGTNYIALKDQYLQIYNGSVPYVRLAYDTNYDGYYQSYLQLMNCYIVGHGSSLDISLYGNVALNLSMDGLSTNGVSCQSLSATNNIHVYGALTVDGTKNANVLTKDYGKVILSCDESPEVMFADRGKGYIKEDGKCIIVLEPIYRQTVDTSDSEYYVFLTGLDCDVKLVERQQELFIVSGTPDTEFLWKVEAYRLGYAHKRFNDMYDWGDELEPKVI